SRLVSYVFTSHVLRMRQSGPAGTPLESEARMDWIDRGLCRTQAERMFAEGAAQTEAKTVCVGCPLRLDCLAYALDNREEYGVWGAMTERERRALLRGRPAVASWAKIFKEARARLAPLGLDR